MKLRSFPIFTVFTAVSFVSSLGAANVTFSTDSPNTGFGGTSLSVANSLGAPATIVFTPNSNISTGVPSNINYGIFTLFCDSCSTQAQGAGSFFNAFTFDLIVTDVTDNAVGKFVGSSTGGTVFKDVSQISLTWVPLSLGPGTSNATSGDFGTTRFINTLLTTIVAPNSGAVPGQSTVEGSIESIDPPNGVPEPYTYGLMGAALCGIGVLRIKSRSTR